MDFKRPALFLLILSFVFLSRPAAAEGAAPASGNAAGDGQVLQPKEVSVDTNKDGKPDRFEYYKDGILVRLEADSNFDDRIDEKGIIENGRLVKVEKDTDGDGKSDQWVTY